LRRLKNRLKSLETARIAIIGGSALENLFKNAKQLSFERAYGTASPLLFAKIESKKRDLSSKTWIRREYRNVYHAQSFQGFHTDLHQFGESSN
jgi:purine nucleoside phosphorylase